MTTIRIATRSSAQARTQAEAVGALLTAARDGVVVEYVFVDTQGIIYSTDYNGGLSIIEYLG